MSCICSKLRETHIYTYIYVYIHIYISEVGIANYFFSPLIDNPQNFFLSPLNANPQIFYRYDGPLIANNLKITEVRSSANEFWKKRTKQIFIVKTKTLFNVFFNKMYTWTSAEFREF